MMDLVVDLFIAIMLVVEPLNVALHINIILQSDDVLGGFRLTHNEQQVDYRNGQSSWFSCECLIYKEPILRKIAVFPKLPSRSLNRREGCHHQSGSLVPLVIKTTYHVSSAHENGSTDPLKRPNSAPRFSCTWLVDSIFRCSDTKYFRDYRHLTPWMPTGAYYIRLDHKLVAG